MPPPALRPAEAAGHAQVTPKSTIPALFEHRLGRKQGTIARELFGSARGRRERRRDPPRPVPLEPLVLSAALELPRTPLLLASARMRVETLHINFALSLLPGRNPLGAEADSLPSTILETFSTRQPLASCNYLSALGLLLVTVAPLGGARNPAAASVGGGGGS